MNKLKHNITPMIKFLLVSAFSFTTFFCAAQKQLLNYQDLQYLLQNNPAQVKDFLKQKDFYSHPSANINETRYLGLIADKDYTDILIQAGNRHTIINLSTTNLQQIELIQKMLSVYAFKNSKGAKIYRIKDGVVSTVVLKENEQQGGKVYIMEMEN